MRKTTLFLSALLMFMGVLSVGAQTWSPTERATTFNSDKYYLIYNTSESQGKYFLTENGANIISATFGTPNSFTGYTTKNLFKVLAQGDGTYFIQAYNGKYVDGVVANADAGQALTIAEYTKEATNKWCTKGSYGDDATTLTANADITSANKVFYIKGGEQYWNGNPSQLALWSDAHPYAFYEVDEAVTANINIYTLKAQIAEYNAIFGSLTGSDTPGDYTKANIEAAKAAIATAQKVLDKGVDADCSAALATLNTAISAITVNPIVSGTYKIVCGYGGYLSQQGVRKALCASSESAFRWATLDENHKPCYWNVKVIDGKVTIQNAAYETWISGLSTLSEIAGTVECTFVGSGQFNLNCGGTFHTQGHSDGAGISGNIVSYGGGSPNTADAWILEPVDAIPDAAITAWEYDVAKKFLAEYLPMQDWATTYRGLSGLITSADQLSSAYDQNECGGDKDGGGVAALIDNDNTTFLHTAYGGDKIPTGHHNLEVTFDAPVGNFMFYIYARNSANKYSNDRPKTITVYGSTDNGANYTKIKTIDYPLPLPTNVTQMQSLWGIIEGGNYTKFRFDVEATNTNKAYFTMAEFQMYAVPTTGDAKTIADDLNAYFDPATTLDKLNALIDKYTVSVASEALEEAKVVIQKTGIGYPKADAAIRVALQTAIGLDPSTSGYNRTIIQALENYKTSAIIELPVSGKAYKIYAQYASKPAQPLYYATEAPADADDATKAKYPRIAAKDEANITDPTSMVFICRQLENGKYVFVNNAGKYLMWCDSGDANKSVSVSGYTDAYEEKNQWIINSPATVGKQKEAFGNVFIYGTGKDNNGYYLTPRWEGEDIDCAFIAGNANEWYYDGAGGNGGKERSPLFKMVEVEYPNTPELLATDDIYGVEAIATWSAPFATVLPAGVEAYTVSTDKGTKVGLSQLEGAAVPANTGVLLVGKAGKVTMQPATTETVATVEEGTNLLGNSAGAAKDVAGKYVLANSNSKMAFYRVNSTKTTLAMNKAFLNVAQGAAVREISFDLTTDAIQNVEMEQVGNLKTYDLSGRQVKATRQGLYIRGGKKFLVK